MGGEAGGALGVWLPGGVGFSLVLCGFSQRSAVVGSGQWASRPSRLPALPGLGPRKAATG